MSHFIRFVFYVRFTVFTIVLMVPFLLLTAIRSDHARKIPVIWHRAMLKGMSIRLSVVGAPETQRPLLLIANHASWVDIVVLGAMMPLSFIAKKQIGDWRIIGHLARLQRTVFVDRARRTESARQAEEIASRLKDGDALVLFAEGTTNDGNGVFPFRSSLVGAAKTAIDGAGSTNEVLLQPVTIAYTHLHGVPMKRLDRDIVAWPGAAPFYPHFRKMIEKGAVDVTVKFGEPLRFNGETDRKVLTRAAEKVIARDLSELIFGRTDYGRVLIGSKRR
jgi:1-acyl-sn-glycerol-3-phosphate acyltransferase